MPDLNRPKPGFSTVAALATGRTAQRLGLERKDKQLASAGVALEQRARQALRAGVATLPPVNPAMAAPVAGAAVTAKPAITPAGTDPDEIWGNAGIAALRQLKAEG